MLQLFWEISSLIDNGQWTIILCQLSIVHYQLSIVTSPVHLLKPEKIDLI